MVKVDTSESVGEILFEPPDQQRTGSPKTLFVAGSKAEYWVGLVANSRGAIIHEAEYVGAKALSASVYIDEVGFLPESSRLPDGTEQDEYDGHSEQFAVVRRGEKENTVVGRMRLIKKGGFLLPSEEYFKDIFENNEAPEGSFEASRFIARHPDRRQQAAISIACLRVTACWLKEQNAEGVFAVVEEPVIKLFDSLGMQYKTLAGFRPIPEYHNTENALLFIDHNSVLSSDIVAEYMGDDVIDSTGIGHFDGTLKRLSVDG